MSGKPVVTRVSPARPLEKRQADAARTPLPGASDASLLPATVAVWQSAVSGNWASGANWSGFTAPTASTGATIAVAGTYVVTIDSADAAGSLTIDDKGATVSDIAGGTLAVTSTLTIDAGTLSLAGGTIQGGTITVAGGKFLASSGTLSGVTFFGKLGLAGAGDALYVEGGLNVGAHGTGSIVNLTGAGAYLDFLDTQTVDHATIKIGGASDAFLYVARTQATGTLTLDKTVSVVLAGLYGHITLTDAAETLVNQGTISAAIEGGVLTISGASAGDLFSNTGSLEASNGGTLLLDATLAAGSLAQFSTAMGGVVELGAGGVLNNAATTLTLGAGQQLTLASGGTIAGGTIDDTGAGLIATAGTLSGVAYLGTLDLGDGQTLAIENGFAGPGSTIDLTGLLATLDFIGSQTVDGVTIDLGAASSTGGIVFDRLAATGTLTFGAAATVAAAGAFATIAFGGSDESLVNAGTFIADGAGDVLAITSAYAGDSFTSTGSLIASNGGSLRLETQISAGGLGRFSTSKGGVLALQSGGTLMNAGTILSLGNGQQLTLGDGGLITGGTIADSGGGLIAAGGTLSGVTYAGTLTLMGSQDLFVQNGLNVSSGIIDLNGSASLHFVDTQTIDNATITLGSDSSETLEFIHSTAKATLTLGSALFIETGAASATIDLSNKNETIVSQGTITSGVSGETLTIYSSHTSAEFTNDGSLMATNGGTLLLELNLSTQDLGQFSTTKGGVLELSQYSTLSNMGSTLTLDPAHALTLMGTIAGGTIDDAGGGLITTYGTLSGVTYLGTLSVNGQLWFNSGLHGAATGAASVITETGLYNDNFVDTQTVDDIVFNLDQRAYPGDGIGLVFTSTASSGTLTFGAGAHIVAGPKSNTGLYLFSANETVINQGTISANGGTLSISGINAIDLLTNNGTFIATNAGALTLIGGVNFTNLDHSALTGGSYEVDANSIMKLSNADNDVTAIATLNARVTLSGANAILTCRNTSTGNYTMLDNSLTMIGTAGSLALLAGRDFAASAAFTDNGMLQLGGSTFTAAAGLTLGSTGRLFGYGSVAGAIAGSGGITASGGTLAVQNAVSGTGTLGAAAGAVLDLQTGFAITETVSGLGTLQLDGAFTLGTAAFAIGAVVIDAGASLAGPGRISGAVANAGALAVSSGTLAISGALTGAGAITVGAGATLSVGGGNFSGATTDNGTIAVVIGTLTVGGSLAGSGGFSVGAGATLDLTAGFALSQAVAGAGILRLDAPITLAAGASLATATVIEAADVTLATGVALSQAAGTTWALTANPGDTITLGGDGRFAEAGTLTASGGGKAHVDVAFINSGLASVTSGKLAFLGATTNNGTMAADGGILQFNTRVTGTGTDTIGAASTLSFLHGASGHQTVSFLAATGLLDLTRPALFAGHIAGFAGSDKIDLVDTAATALSYAHGTLDVLDGATTVASLRFTGSYTVANFALSSDGGNGSMISFHV